MNDRQTADASRVTLRHIGAEQFPNPVTVHYYDCMIDGGIPDPVCDRWAMVNAIGERLYNGHG